MVVVVVTVVFITAAATLHGLPSTVAALLCGDELMQKEGTNSAALTFRVENLLSMDLSWGGPTISPLVSACCSHESGAMLFAILISCFSRPHTARAEPGPNKREAKNGIKRVSWNITEHGRRGGQTRKSRTAHVARWIRRHQGGGPSGRDFKKIVLFVSQHTLLVVHTHRVHAPYDR